MAESQAVAKQALEKLEDQLTCAICLDAFKDPKLLQCFHVYCKDCLQRLVVTDRQGQLSLRCPTCRQSTLLPPATGVSGLQPVFHIHHLFEIHEILEKVKEPQKVQYEMCKKSQMATKFCQDCGKFVCEKCVEMHSEWDEFSNHEVVSMEQVQSNVKQLVPPKKEVTLYCSLHSGKELDLYCETCGELICLHCTVKKHKDHQYNLVGDTFQRHKAEIIASLEPIEKQLGVVTKALEQLDVQSLELDDLQATLEANIQRQIRMLQELLEARKAELINQMQQLIQVKKKNLAVQKDEVETVHAQLTSCLSFVRESLRTGSQGEVMKMKKAVVKQIKEMTHNFKPDMLPPCEPANVGFMASSDFASACQQFGKVYLQQVSTEKSHATGKGLELAKLGERATAVLHVVDDEYKAYTKPVKSLICELVSESTGEKIDCSVKKTEASGQYEISYQATSRGRHQLHIIVEGKHIMGSPFPFLVKLPLDQLGKPMQPAITGGYTDSGEWHKLNYPWGVAINSKGNIIVSENSGCCISVINPAEDKVLSFGGDLDPMGVAVDDDDNILVADRANKRIQKFTSNGTFISATPDNLGLKWPLGIAIHPHSKEIYVADSTNSCITVLNPDLTFSSSFGSHGSGNGQFSGPIDVAFDSTGNVYVTDTDSYNVTNNRIQVFTAKGEYLRQLRKDDGYESPKIKPTGICIDREDVVYVTDVYNARVSLFKCDGTHIKSFGSHGSASGEFLAPWGIALDEHENIYVADYQNNRIQKF